MRDNASYLLARASHTCSFLVLNTGRWARGCRCCFPCSPCLLGRSASWCGRLSSFPPSTLSCGRCVGGDLWYRSFASVPFVVDLAVKALSFASYLLSAFCHWCSGGLVPCQHQCWHPWCLGMAALEWAASCYRSPCRAPRSPPGRESSGFSPEYPQQSRLGSESIDPLAIGT